MDIPLSLILTTIQKTGAPECFRANDFDDGRWIPITQSVDIYSLGCVLSDVCIWMVSGAAGLNKYRHLRRSHNSAVPRGADCFHINGQTSAAVHHQHDLALGSVRCDRTTAHILMLLPDLMRTDPACRPRAWMLSSVFNEFLLSDDARRSDRSAAMLHQLMSSEQISTKFEQQVRIFYKPPAPAEAFRGIRIQFSEQHDATAARLAATDLGQASFPVGRQAGTRDASESVSSDHLDATSKEELTHPTRLTCLFKFLGCTRTFAGSAEEWYEHSKTHLRGRRPPAFLRCPYESCPWAVSGVEAWELRWAHLQQTHDLMSDGENVCEKRDGRLFEYLWKAHLISSAQLQELRRRGRLGMQAETRDASPVSSDYRQQETSLGVVETSTVTRKRKGLSLGDPTSGSSASMAISIDKPVRERVPHYRLTREIIGRVLQKIFPDYDLRAFDIQVDICSFIRLRSYHTNAELGVHRRFYFLSTPSADNGAQTSTLLDSLTLTNFYQDERYGILARRIQDDYDL